MANSRKVQSEERRNQIIDAALQVFATKGFSAATNRDIARAAGINSPGLIYHYFTDQDALLEAVLQERAPVVQFSLQPEELLSLPPEVVLPEMARLFMQTFHDPQTLALIRLVLSEALRRPAFANQIFESGSSHIVNFLATYLQSQMDQGALRKIDVGAAIRIFTGPLFLYMVTTLLLEVAEPHTPTPETLIETHIATFLRGLVPD